jgi:predicted transcriptional regulator
MPFPCEFAVRSVVPALRALVARELSTSYHLKQDDIASLLGITQSAVSQYLRHVRGRAVNIEEITEIHEITQTLAMGLANNKLSQRHITQQYCKACQIIRQKRLLCQVHKRLDASFDVVNCDACIP